MKDVVFHVGKYDFCSVCGEVKEVAGLDEEENPLCEFCLNGEVGVLGI